MRETKMTESKTSEAQKKASKAYYEKNKERALMNKQKNCGQNICEMLCNKRGYGKLNRNI